MSAVLRSLPSRASAAFKGFTSRTPPLPPSSFSSSHLATTIQRLPFSFQDTTIQQLPSQTLSTLAAVDSIQMATKLEDHGIPGNEAEAVVGCCTVGTLKDGNGIFIGPKEVFLLDRMAPRQNLASLLLPARLPPRPSSSPERSFRTVTDCSLSLPQDYITEEMLNFQLSEFEVKFEVNLRLYTEERFGALEKSLVKELKPLKSLVKELKSLVKELHQIEQDKAERSLFLSTVTTALGLATVAAVVLRQMF